MLYNKLTKEYCDYICENSECFVRKEDEIDGYKIYQYQYLISSYEEFNKFELSNELRGICFVYNKDNTLNKRYLMLHKFYNILENPSTQLNILSEYELINTHDKMDGSLIRFIKLPNGRVLAKTKFSFTSDQAIAAQKIYDSNLEMKLLIDNSLNIDKVLLFEYISPNNRIVVPYNKEELILLKERDESSGMYFNELKFDYDFLKVTKGHNFKTIEEVISDVENKENFEGYVCDLQHKITKEIIFVKVKCKWYCNLHSLLDSILHEDVVIDFILNDKIDDVISQLKQFNFNIEPINNLKDKINTYIINLHKDIIKIVQDNITLSRKDFAIKFKNDKTFKYLIKQYELYNKEFDLISYIKKDILKECRRLELSRKFIKNELKYDFILSVNTEE